jgi:ribonuclease Z
MLFAGVTAHQVTRVCVTHFHGDHSLGLPGVLQRMALDQVTGTVEVAYPASGADIFGHIRKVSLFHDTLSLRERPVPEAGAVLADGPAFRLEARPLSHSVPAVGYRLTEPDGRRMLPAELAARGITGADVGRLQRAGSLERNGGVVHLADVSTPRRGQKFAFIMDTRLCDAVFELADDTDLLVCESTFADADADLAARYGHLTAGQAARSPPRPPPAAWSSPISPSATTTPAWRNCCATRPPPTTARSSWPPTSTGSPSRPASG